MKYKTLVKVFRTNNKYYMFDANKNTIIELTAEEYYAVEQYISKDDIEDELKVIIEQLRDKGFLSSNKVKRMINRDDELIETYIENGLEMLILQVTQQCNFRCKYCAYSGNYINRTHSNIKMKFSIAAQAIDYLITHSKNNHTIWVNFYGGEPLLEFELIKKCIDYAEEKAEGKTVKFGMTTNGYLLKNEVLDFLYKHDVKVTISIDGPKKIHDKNRRLAGQDKGSYDVVMNNLAQIRILYPDYIKSISINSVIDTQGNFNELREFMENSKEIEGITITAGGIAEENVIECTKEDEKFICDRDYEIFKCYYALIRKNENKFGQLLAGEYRQIIDTHLRLNTHSKLPESISLNGPCIAGAKRLFVTVEGDFYPCEKSSEKSKLMKLGDIVVGVDSDRVRKISDTGNINAEACKECWAIEHCSMCQAMLDSIEDEYSKEKLEEICEAQKYEIEEGFRNYCMLKEFGYQFKVEKPFVFSAEEEKRIYER